MTLNQWAAKWGVPYAAVEDYRREVGAMHDGPPPPTEGGESEQAVQARVRLEASAAGMRLWRNNVGAMYDEKGNYMRFGLANDSAQMNAQIKSSDLIGIRPIRIGPEHMGGVIGQFIAREVKAENWIYTATVREQAQQRFMDLVICMGGDAAFANREGTL